MWETFAPVKWARHFALRPGNFGMEIVLCTYDGLVARDLGCSYVCSSALAALVAFGDAEDTALSEFISLYASMFCI